MSTATESHAAHGAAEEEHDHPSDLMYVKIALILGALTLIEVLTYTFGMEGAALMAVIFPIMILKFVIVAGYFMHLKFDSRMFTTMFVAGLAFAVVVYCVMLTAFRFW
jgi:cytochrome c oxidase subunit 4